MDNFEKYESFANKIANEMEKEYENNRVMMIRKILDKCNQMLASQEEKKSSWLRFLVSTAAVLCGILVSLGTPSSMQIQIRIPYIVGVVSLALGVLTLSMSLYSQIYYMQEKIRLFSKEAKKALEENRLPSDIMVAKVKLFSVFEIVGYICFSCSLLSLCVYMILCAFL